MDTAMQTLLIGLTAFLATFLGGLFALRFRDKLHLITGFSAGAVIAAALFDLLPESFELTAGMHDISFIALLIGAGFVAYMLLDRLFHTHHGDDCHNEHQGSLGAASLCFHSFLDGLMIGVAFQASPAIGWVVAAAVLTHDFSDGVNTVSIVLKNGAERGKAMAWLITDSLAPVLGVLVGIFTTIENVTLGAILAVTCGSFLYIGASHLLPESHHAHPKAWTTFATLLGFAALYAVTRLAGI